MYDENIVDYPSRTTANFRSLGGLPVEGGYVKQYKIFRSDNLVVSPPQQLVNLRQRGVTTAIDLRAREEIHSSQVARLSEYGITHLHRPMTENAADPKTLAVTLNSITNVDDVGDWYFMLTKTKASTLVTCFKDIIDADGGLVFYCAAGKDRTGVLAAALLLMLGASDETIIDDFVGTSSVLPAIYERLQYTSGKSTLAQRFPDHPLLLTAPESMERYLKIVHDAGGIEAVLAHNGQHASGRVAAIDDSDPGAQPLHRVEDVAAIGEHLRNSLVSPSK